MTVIWKTQKINIQNYYKILRRTVIITNGRAYWQKFKKEWTINVIPVTESEKYKDHFKHLNIEKISLMAWGVTGKNVLWWFVTDSRNFRTMMQNVPPGMHEVLHAICQDEVGTSHVTRKYDAPEGKKGTKGPAATVLVHDVWYGSKRRLKMWIFYGIPPWIPLTIPLLILKQAKIDYNL